MDNQSYELLLVDDNPTNLSLLQELVLQNLPECRVRSAANGADALELAFQHPPDGAFIDMQMPGMDGIEVCRRLKADERTAAVPVILITAHQSSPELRAEGLDAGAQDFISQPIRNVELVARIRTLLRIRTVEQQLRSANQGLRKQVVQKTAALRWVTGLISAGDASSGQPGSEIIQQLSSLLHDDGELDFSHFSGELFARFPDNLRRSLLKLSLIETIPGGLAERLAAIDDIRSALDYLVRHNYFVRYQPENDSFIFQDHFREYLGTRARQEFDGVEIRQVFVQAADWYLGQNAFAAGLSYQLLAGDQDGAERVISQIGPLLYGEGDVCSLLSKKEILTRLDCERYPWLGCMFGLALLESEPLKARSWIDGALKNFVNRKDLVGQLYAAVQLVHYSCLIDGDFVGGRTLLLQADELFISQDLSGVPHLQIQAALYLAAGHLLFNGDFQSSDLYLAIAAQRILEQNLLEYQALTRFVRGQLQLHQGRWRACVRELELTSRYIDSEKVNLSTRLLLLNLRATLLENMGDVLGSRRQKNLARRQASTLFFEQSLVRPQLLLLDVQSEIAHGHYQQAAELLDIALSHPGGQTPLVKAQLLQFRACIAAWTGDSAAALKAAEKASELRQRVGGPIDIVQYEICLGLVRYELGDVNGALLHLDAGVAAARQLENKFLICSALAYRGLARHRGGQIEESEGDLREWLKIMEAEAFCHIYGWNPRQMTALFALALALGIDSALPCTLGRSRLYTSFRDDGSRLPLLRFRILGDFSLSIGGTTIQLRKDLSTALRQLLGMILTAPNLQLSQEEVQNRFWPDSSSEKSRSKFDSLLSRLRKALDDMLGDDSVKDYLSLQKGTLCIDHSWVDAAEFEALVRNGLRHAKRKESWQADQAFRRAHRLWRGELNLSLPLDEGHEYYRQDLLLLYLESALAWMDLLIEQKLYDDVFQIGQKALQYDPISDDLVRRLYHAHLLAGKVVSGNQVLRSYAAAMAAEGYGAKDIEETVDAVAAMFSPAD